MEKKKKKKIFVFGWYNHNNLGDEAFKESFEYLWGKSVEFAFGCKIPLNINDYDACFVGGGSFLDQEIPGLKSVSIPLGFIGVGVHSFIHPTNIQALKNSKIIITRGDILSEQYTKNPKNQFIASDLVFARDIRSEVKQNLIPTLPDNNVILIIGNEFLTPKRNSPIWKYTSFHWFLTEFSKLCDEWVDQKYSIKFYPMCTGDKFDDRFFASHIVSQMEKHKNVFFHFGHADENELIQNISQSKLVVSMRFHGNIFSTILGKPFIGINSHDKMKTYFHTLRTNNFLDYYGFTSSTFRECAENNKIEPSYLLEYAGKEKDRWRYLSDIVAETFAM